MENNKIENLIIEALKAEGKKIKPPRELLAKIVQNTVTKTETKRYLDRGVKNRVSFFNSIFNWKVFAGAGTLMIMIFFLFITQIGLKALATKISGPATSLPAIGELAREEITEETAKETDQEIIPEAEVYTTENKMAVAADSVDEAVDAILAEFLEEDAFIEDESNKMADLVSFDDENETINNFMKIYEEEQL